MELNMLDKLKSFFKKTAEAPAEAIVNIEQPYPQIGDRVSHEGNFSGYSITKFIPRAVMTDTGPVTVILCVFESQKNEVTCNLNDLQWLDEDMAWYLPGRLLDANLKARWREHMSKNLGYELKYGPSENKHVEARDFLRAVGVL
jgi:hypothetical protein